MNDIIKAVLPWIGTALAGPAGAGVATWLAPKIGLDSNDVESVKSALTTALGNPEQVVKLRELELQYQQAQITAGVTLAQLEAQIVVEVNKTMQVESTADHWPTYSWRPFIGFSFGLYILSLFLLPLVGLKPERLSVDEMLAIGGVLGVTAWFRGKMQADPQIKSDNRG
jgi:hypothetical protein